MFYISPQLEHTRTNSLDKNFKTRERFTVNHPTINLSSVLEKIGNSGGSLKVCSKFVQPFNEWNGPEKFEPKLSKRPVNWWIGFNTIKTDRRLVIRTENYYKMCGTFKLPKIQKSTRKQMFDILLKTPRSRMLLMSSQIQSLNIIWRRDKVRSNSLSLHWLWTFQNPKMQFKYKYRRDNQSNQFTPRSWIGDTYGLEDDLRTRVCSPRS